MADPRELYVDPVAGVDAAGGGLTLADPYLTTQFALNDINVTHGGRDAANGDQINVRSDQPIGTVTATDDVTVAVLSLAAYGAPAVDAPLIFRGYRFAEGDGGIGGMDGNNGGWSIYDGVAGGTDYVHFHDMHLHNTGAANVLQLQAYGSVIGCEVDTTLAVGIGAGSPTRIMNNHLHDCATDSIQVANYGHVCGNYIDTSGTMGIWIGGAICFVNRNIVVCSAVATIGITVSSSRGVVQGNSILNTAAGTGQGIDFDANNHYSTSIMDNLIEGFSGVGGDGIDWGTAVRHYIYANNSFYDNTNDEANAGDFEWEADNDLAMAASPFLKTGAMTFANRFGYFAPAIPVRGRAFPNGCQFDRGAVQVRLAVEREIAEQTIVTIPARTVLDPL